MPKRKINPKSLANLKQPWTKGESGNPEGKNLKRPFSDRYHRMAETPAPPELIHKVNREFKNPILPEGSSWAELTTARLYLQIVIKGDTRALAEIVDRVEGRAPTRLDLMATTHNDVTIRVVEDQPTLPRNRAAQVMFEYCRELVKSSDDSEVMEMAAAFALLLRKKGNVVDAKSKTA